MNEKKITMLTDKDCIQCAIFLKVIEEYCSKNRIKFEYIEKDDIPEQLRPFAYPTLKVQYNQAQGQLWVDVASLEYFKDLSNDFRELFLKKHW